MHSIVAFHSENDTSEVGRHFLATKLYGMQLCVTSCEMRCEPVIKVPLVEQKKIIGVPPVSQPSLSGYASKLEK